MENLTQPQITNGRIRCSVLSLVLATSIVTGVVSSVWELHGVLTEHANPVMGEEKDNFSFLISVLIANVGAVALAGSGILTFGVGTLLLAPVVAANLGILLGAGQAWLSPEAFLYGLAIHGAGEALAVILGTAAGVHPILRLLPGFRDRTVEERLIARYIRATSETVPYLVLVAAVLIISALWETFVSSTLV